jgi:hypothetical protein
MQREKMQYPPCNKHAFYPTKVTNFVGVVFCTFVQRFRSSENTFFENFCRSRTQADNEMQILRMAGIPGVFALPAKCRFCCFHRRLGLTASIHIFLLVLIESEVSFLFLEGA